MFQITHITLWKTSSSVRVELEFWVKSSSMGKLQIGRWFTVSKSSLIFMKGNRFWTFMSSTGFFECLGRTQAIININKVIHIPSSSTTNHWWFSFTNWKVVTPVYPPIFFGNAQMAVDMGPRATFCERPIRRYGEVFWWKLVVPKNWANKLPVS